MQSLKLLNSHKRLFISILAVYAIASLVLVQGFGSGDIPVLKDTLGELFTGNFGQLASGLIVFAALVGSAGNSGSEVGSTYQLFLTLFVSLALIWALRQVSGGVRIRMRDAYYHGMYPLIPFIIVLFVIGLQLIPLIVGSGLYSIVVANGIAVFPAEKILWALLFALLGLLSLYMITSSLFALYIATLPDMTPLKALRSARELVRFRRWTVLRKVLFVPVALLIVAAILMLPVILFATAAAQWAFFILSTASLAVFHAYMYTLYRELLNE